MRPVSKAIGTALGLGALVLASVGAAGAAGWQPAQPYDGGPGCVINENGLPDWHYNEAIEHDYKIAGQVKGDTLIGKYVQRFDNVMYVPNNPNPEDMLPSDPDYKPWDPDAPSILVTGQVAFTGEVTMSDFSDISTVTYVSEDTELKWSYTISDLEGEYLAVAGGTIGFDPSSGEPVYDRAYGPCWEP